MVLPVVSSVMDVIVIGCGASGVAALRSLHDAGVRALGLEAAGRIGGRINTVPFADGVIDLGAQWCHGEEDNAVFELVRELDVLRRPTMSRTMYLTSDGHAVADDVAQDVVETFNKILEQAEKNNQLSLKDYLRDQVKKTNFFGNNNLVDSILEWFERNNHVGGQEELKQTKSLRSLEEHWPCGGEFLQNWNGRGYKTLLDILLKSYPNPSERLPIEILLNKEVEMVKWKSTSPRTESGNPLVQVVCKDGSMYAAKCVIVTVSIAVLQQRHENMFKPSLPKEKIKTIQNLSMCVLDKIYVKFDKPWWPKDTASFNLVWREGDKKNDGWISEIYSASTVEYQKNLLCFWIYGEGAKKVERVRLDEVKNGILQILRIFFSNYEVTEILDIIRSQWSSDPFTGGAYSYRSVQTEQAGSGARALSEPLLSTGGLPTVCFAGEASSHNRHSAVHGAVEAGMREAKRIIDALVK